MSGQKRKIFGTDGVRGKANCPPMDCETALRLGRAIATVFRGGPHRHRIVVGKDTRLSGYMLETAIASGICSMGVDVMLVGPLPTPGIAFIAKSMRADAGAVISASHNPYYDNGIKFFDKDGFKLPDELELKIEDLVLNRLDDISRPTDGDIGRAIRVDDSAGRYIQFVKDSFPEDLTLDGLRLVVDCANGAGYKVAPEVFTELGAEVIEIGNRPDGVNINDGVGSLHPEKMCGLVKKMSADAGIALDGDADRVIMCDEKGNVINGDVIMALAAKNLKSRGHLAMDTLVTTVMSNLALDQAMKKSGINVVRTQVGDRYVINEMREKGYNLGGEQSGHMIFMEHNTTGDGVMGGLKVLACMCREQKALSELSGIFEPFPQIRIDVPVTTKQEFAKVPEIMYTVETFKKELGDSGRLLLRFSGTENLARILVEGKSRERISSMANDLAGLVKTHMGGF